MTRIRLGAAVLALAAAAMGLVIRTPQAFAAAEIHRFNLVLSASPTSIDGGDFNKDLDHFNGSVLELNGREGLDKLTFGWLFQAEMRYFVRPNIAVSAGVGQIKAVTHREFLPALNQQANVTGEVLSVPVDVGAAYYMQPYNQGDFQARAFIGAGVTSMVYNRATFEVRSNIPSGSDPLASQYKNILMRDAPGWYVETGVHMFFAARYSVLISGVYRGARVREMVDSSTRQPVLSAEGTPYVLDFSGVGVRGALAIGF